MKFFQKMRMETLAIILCTYNGDRFLKKQLDSYKTQTFKDWTLFVFDDQSTDQTENIIKEFSKTVLNKVIFTRNKEKLGFAKNFLYNLRGLDGFNYYAFSDQDDIWLNEKLERAIDFLDAKNAPSLYCGRTKLIDENENFLGFSPIFKKKPNFKNALVQSIAGGNTMVFNKKLYEKICQFKYTDVITHDWIIYQITTALNGNVFYDRKPFVLYRQHQSNVIGSNNGIIAKLFRLKRLLRSEFLKWNDQNIFLLKNNLFFIKDKNKKTLHFFEKSRKDKFFFKRIYLLKKSGVYRQTFFGHIALYFACLLKKI